jgi:hypothetical protein
MADTPDKLNLEKRLQEYARQRRESAGTPAMHPALRRLLQAEVRQQHGPGQPAPARPAGSWLARYWPRLVFACAVVAAVAGITVLVLPSGEKAGSTTTFAKLEDSKADANGRRERPPVSPALATAPAPASAPAARLEADRATESPAVRALPSAPPAPAAPAVAGGAARPENSALARRVDDSLKTLVTREAGRNLGAASQSASGSILAKDGSGAGGAESRRDNEASSDAVAAGDSMDGRGQAAPTMAANSAKGPAAFSATANKAAFKATGTDLNQAPALAAGQVRTGATQAFRNVAFAEQRGTRVRVLDEFTVEQNGETMTIVDQDGSVYNGYARAVPAEAAGQGWAVNAPTPRASGGGGASSALPMKAAGDAPAIAKGGEQQTAPVAPSRVTQNQGESGPPNYSFRVEGTNRSLNQRVVFTGNMLQSNLSGTVQNAVNSQILNNQLQQFNTLTLTNSDKAQQLQAPGFNNFINGRVQVGNEKAGTELNALSIEH